MAAVGNVTVQVELKPPLGQGFFVYVPVSDALMEGAERGSVVEDCAADYAADAARAAVKNRRRELLYKDKGDRG